MDSLDSRSLGYLNCYAQKFSVPGRVSYTITTASGAWLPLDGDDTFTIEVRARDDEESEQEAKQHNVVVQREGARFVAVPPYLKIRADDTVLWNTSDAAAPGYAIYGEGADSSFNSATLSSQAIYTHVFSAPGEYRWVDANGGQVSGIVEVKNVEVKTREEFTRWMESLQAGAAITIIGNDVDPDRVQILMGQTVFWSVEQAPGISITDARLVQ